MNTKQSSSKLAILSCMLMASIALSAQTTTNLDHASAQIEEAQDHLHGGSELAFRLKLDKPLPQGAYFSVRLSPVSVNQELAVNSTEPANKERTEFVLRTKLPDGAASGEWHIQTVYLFLAGSTWTTSVIGTNDLHFKVEGPKVELPTRAEASILKQ